MSSVIAIVSKSNFSRPEITATLKSSDSGRKIELSTDGGIEYFLPEYDVSTATMLVVTITSPLTHIRFTGADAGTDKWSVL